MVIIGNGKAGSSLASMLSNEGHDVTVIDINTVAANKEFYFSAFIYIQKTAVKYGRVVRYLVFHKLHFALFKHLNLSGVWSDQHAQCGDTQGYRAVFQNVRFYKR